MWKNFCRRDWKIGLWGLGLWLSIGMYSGVYAQCAMCRAAAKSQATAQETLSRSPQKGINTAIIYMLLIPYVSLGLVGWAWYRQRKRRKEAISR